MLPPILRAVVLCQDCFQLYRLFGGNRRACFKLSLVTDDVFGVAFVAFNGGDIVEFLRSLLPGLTCSNGDCFHIKMCSHRDKSRAGQGKITTRSQP